MLEKILLKDQTKILEEVKSKILPDAQDDDVRRAEPTIAEKGSLRASSIWEAHAPSKGTCDKQKLPPLGDAEMSHSYGSEMHIALTWKLND